VSADAGIDIVYPYAVIAGILPADVLVDGIFLIGTGRVAVKCEESLFRIINLQSEIVQVLYHIGASEVPGSTGVNCYVNNVTRFYVSYLE
jgi:hypothetical protein